MRFYSTSAKVCLDFRSFAKKINMAKEFRRSTASSEKRPFKKTRSTDTPKPASGKRNREGRSDEENWQERSSGERKPKFAKTSKKGEEQSSFKRYRDTGKPSDFGATTNKRTNRYSNDTVSSQEDRPYRKRTDSKEHSFKEKSFKEKSFRDKPFRDKSFPSKKKKEVNPYDLDESDFEYAADNDDSREPSFKKRKDDGKPTTEKRKAETSSRSGKKEDGLTRLNKYISNAGICSRREADELIASGVVQVNGKTITEMGFKVKPTDVIKYGGQTLKKERMVYLILNKPKDYITTVDDPQKRKTVLELVHDACKERIYPVGRLDRSTTGLLMFTNDGELTKKLTHPKYGVRKIYHVELDKPLKKQDLDQIVEGLELEDGLIKVDEISYVGDGKDKSQIGVELHSGKNRIVRRIFEHLGYNVRKLDRVMFGPLTKKDLPRGRWRFLTQAEVGIMNMISSD